MRAVTLTTHGDLDALRFEREWPVPGVGSGEVLVRVGACALNNTDINTRVGWYANGAWSESMVFPRIQGADVCGRVVRCGSLAPSSLLGARVLIDPWLRDPDRPTDRDRCGYVGSERDGGYADYVAVPARNASVIASQLSDVELASFPTAAGTALNMIDRVDIGEGDVVLITGASGGVGTALVQLVRTRGAVPVAMCAPAKEEFVRSLGAVAVIHPGIDQSEQLRAAIGRDQVDVVADVVGGDGWVQLIGLLARGGRYTVAGAIAGPIVPLDLRTLYLSDLTFAGVSVTPPGLFAELVSIIERGQIAPVVSATFGLEQLHNAQTAFIEKRFTGKIVLDLSL